MIRSSADTAASHAELLQMAAESRLDSHISDQDWTRALEAGAAALRSQPAWQPIATAPKDGTLVLLWKPNTGERFAAAYIQGGYGYGWCTPDGFEIFKATHWMPLPDPPQIGSAPDATEAERADATRRSAAQK